MSSRTPVKFILGTHTIGDSSIDSLAAFDKPTDVRDLLDAFKSRGYNELDSARNYSVHAPGSSEPRLGDAGAASSFVIHTKVMSGTPGDHTAAKLENSIAQSLKDLQTPTVQTMMLHVPDRETPFKESLKTMNQGVLDGKFKTFGLSNYTPEEVKQIVDICERNGYAMPAVYEGHYNVVVRGGEKDLLPLLRKHNIAFFAFSPAAGGLFSGNSHNAARWTGEVSPHEKRTGKIGLIISKHQMGDTYRGFYGKAPVQNSIQTVLEAAEKNGISGHAAALRWIAYHSALDGTHGDGIVFGVSKVEQLHKTLDALEAGPLPEDVAGLMGGIYASLEGNEPPYHL